MDPFTGSYRYYDTTAIHQGTTGGSILVGLGIEYEFQFHRIPITTPAPVPLPAGGLLLASAFGSCADADGRQLSPASAVR